MKIFSNIEWVEGAKENLTSNIKKIIKPIVGGHEIFVVFPIFEELAQDKFLVIEICSENVGSELPIKKYIAKMVKQLYFKEASLQVTVRTCLGV